MQLRKVIKNRGHFPSDESATKLIYLALRNIVKKWKKPPVTWSAAARQFAIQFGGNLGAQPRLQEAEPKQQRKPTSNTKLRTDPAVEASLLNATQTTAGETPVIQACEVTGGGACADPLLLAIQIQAGCGRHASPRPTQSQRPPSRAMVETYRSTASCQVGRATAVVLWNREVSSTV